MLAKLSAPSASASWTPRRKFSSAMLCEYSEYSPSLVQCHAYTAAPASGDDPPEPSTTVRLTVNGTPSATPDAEPKLGRMSRRTMPLSVSTLGPLERSPG